MMPGPMQRIIIGYEAQRHIIEKPSTYQKLIDMARARFSIPDGTDLSLRWFPDLGSSASIEMSTDSMYCSVGDLTYVTFSTTVYNASGDDSVAMVPLHSTGDSHLEKKRKRSSSELIRVFVKTFTGKTIWLPCMPTTPVSQFKEAIQGKEGTPPDRFRLIFAGHQLEDGMTLADYRIGEGNTVHMAGRLRGAKPAMYLLSPVPLEDVNISMTLSPQWSFTLIYPLAEPVTDAKHNTSRVDWTVSVRGESVADHATGSTCSYLFWEAETGTNPAASSSSIAHAPVPSGDGEVFDPSAPSLTPENACVLPYDTFIPRLEHILEHLRLTPAMRTEFIVYWLPRFQQIRDKGLHIAFRFVNQDAFSRAAKIEVSGCPPPAAIARIFLLFGGVSSTNVDGRWVATTHTATEAEAFNWAERIGFDINSWDPRTFRILEWGGMEVPGSMLD